MFIAGHSRPFPTAPGVFHAPRGFRGHESKKGPVPDTMPEKGPSLSRAGRVARQGVGYSPPSGDSTWGASTAPASAPLSVAVTAAGLAALAPASAAALAAS